MARPRNQGPIFQQRTPEQLADGPPAIVQRIRRTKETHPRMSRALIAQKVGVREQDVTDALTTPTYLKNLAKRKLKLGARALGVAEAATAKITKGLQRLKSSNLDTGELRDLGWLAGTMSKQANELIGAAALDAELESDAELGGLFKQLLKEKGYGRLRPDPTPVPPSEQLQPVVVTVSIPDEEADDADAGDVNA